MKKYIGIDIGGTKCAVVLGNENGDIISKVRFQTLGKDETLARICEEAQKLKGEACAVGISCGGPLDSENGIILSPPNLPGWDKVPVTEILKEKTGLPAYLCNDANACALAEWKFGAGRGTKNMIFMTFGTGMGAGLILGGKLYAGTSDMAGEIGHVRLSAKGPVGYGKSGSVEGFCSGGGIAQLAKAAAVSAMKTGKKVLFCENEADIDNITAYSVAEAARNGDATAINIYRKSGRMLGKALSVLIDVINPERIVIGSIFARSGELMRREMMRVISAEALERSRSVCDIVPAALGENIGDIAALTIAVNGEENK